MLFITLCLIAEVAMLAYLVYMLIKYKKMTLKTTAIYPILILVAVLIIFVGEVKYGSYDHAYQAAIFALSNALDLVTLSAKDSIIKLFQEKNILYLIGYIGAYVLSFLALMSISISLFVAFIKNLLLISFVNKQTNYVINLTDDTKAFIDALDKKNKRYTVVLLPSKPGVTYIDEKLFCNDRNVKYSIAALDGNAFAATMNLCTFQRKRRKYIFVVSAANDDELYRLTVKISDYVNAKKLYDFSVRYIINSSYRQNYFLKDVIRGKPENETVINSKGKEVPLLDESRGVITCLDKYEIIAFNFITEHNFAKYIPEDYKNADGTVKDVNINLYIFGFGKVNRYLLREILIINQFIVKTEDGKLAPNPINVHIYDNHEESETDMSMLSNGIYKYRKKDFDQSNYFDLPDDYYSHLHTHFDKAVNSLNVYNEIRKNIMESKKPTVNYFIVALGSDIQNALVAKSLSEYMNEISSEKHNTIFMRAKKRTDLPVFDTKKIIPFGEDDGVFAYENVVNNQLLRKAKIQSLRYQGVPVTEENLDKEWTTLSPIKRMSNVSAVMSIPFKLACIGITTEENLTRDKFLSIYEPNGKTPTRNADFFTKAHESYTPRDVLAFMEHCRWNAYELSQGVLPKKKSGLEDGKFASKSANELRHMNIATHVGLAEFERYATSVNEKYQEKNDTNVVPYDYDLMDNYLKEDAEFAKQPI